MRPAVWILSIFATSLVGTPACAQWRPNKNVELVAPATPGGGYDTLARAVHKVIAQQKLLSVPINVVNKAGGGSSIGWSYVSQRTGDGHYVAVASSTLLTNDVAGINSFKWTDLTPLGVLSTEYLVFSTRTEAGLRSAKELIAAIRSNPKNLKFATAPGPGNANHIVMGMVAKAVDVDIRQIPLVFFPSAGDSTTAALGGHVDVVVSSIPPVLGHVNADRMRILAVGAPHRLPGIMANVPTWRELGVDAVFVNWRGIVGPKNLAGDQVRFWEDLFRSLAQSEAWKSYSIATFSEPTYIDSASTSKLFATQHADVGAIMTDLGLKK